MQDGVRDGEQDGVRDEVRGLGGIESLFTVSDALCDVLSR